MGRLALLFYCNPRMLALVIGLVVVCGMTAVAVLPRLEDPQMKPRAATIRTVFPGASASRVETLVTDLIERELQEVQQIRLTRSGSRRGYSLIAIELQDHIERVEEIWAEIRDRLSDVSRQLPPGCSEPEFENLEFRSTSLLLSMRWDGQGNTPWPVVNRLSRNLADKLRSISGTDKVETYGMPDEEFLIEVPRQALMANGLSMTNLAAQIRRSDAKVSAGNVTGGSSEMLLQIEGDFDSVSRLADLPITPGASTLGPNAVEAGIDNRAIVNNAMVDTVFPQVRLGDLARIVKRSALPWNDRVLIHGKESVVISCFLQKDRRIDLWTQDAKETIDTFSKTMPKGMVVEIDFRQADYVGNRLRSLLMNFALGSLGVMIVVLLMMGWRGSLLVGLTLPLTCMGVLASMWVLKIPLHQMSITGIILAIGLLIDNAIIVVDEIQQAIAGGQPVRQALVERINHLTIPLLGSTTTTILAFAPLILMIGPAAEYVYTISTSVIAAVGFSFFLSMAIIPAVMGWLRRVPANETSVSQLPERSFSNFADQGLRHAGAARVYRMVLIKLFQFPLLGMLLAATPPLLGFWAAFSLPEQFFPSADRDQFTIKLLLADGASANQTVATAKEARQLLLEDPAIKRVDWYISRSAPPFYVNLIPLRKDMPHYAQAFVSLKSGTASKLWLEKLQDRLQKRIPHASVNVKSLQLGPPLDDPIEIRVFGPDPDQLDSIGRKIRKLLSETVSVTSTSSHQGKTVPSVFWKFDTPLLARLDLDRHWVASELSAQLDGVRVGGIIQGRDEIPVRVRLPESQRSTTSQIQRVQFQHRNGSRIVSTPITAIGEMSLVPSESAIQRIDSQRVNEVRARVQTGRLPSVVLEDFKRSLVESGFQLPEGYEIIYGGEAAERDRAVGNLLATGPVLGLIIFSVLVLSFRSFRSAILISIIGGLSVGLGLLALFVFGYPFGFMAIVGTMGLVGVAINDSIVVLAGLVADPDAKRGDPVAAANVVLRSTRHVLATTLTTVAGFLPLLVQGGGFWPPLAISIAGGVFGATLLALYFVPSFYLITHPFQSNPATVSFVED